MTGSEEKARVLVVDDEHVIADTLRMIFSNAGMEAKAAYSAGQALELISAWVPNAAIIDVHLPGINGIELAIHLKAKYPNCALILFSGDTSTGDLMEKAERDGHSFDVLAKPVHPSDLLKRITRQLAGAESGEADEQRKIFG